MEPRIPEPETRKTIGLELVGILVLESFWSQDPQKGSHIGASSVASSAPGPGRQAKRPAGLCDSGLNVKNLTTYRGWIGPLETILYTAQAVRA